jgi:hypothetical protein
MIREPAAILLTGCAIPVFDDHAILDPERIEPENLIRFVASLGSF